MSISICFIYLGAPFLGAYILMSVKKPPLVLMPLSLYNALPSLFL